MKLDQEVAEAAMRGVVIGALLGSACWALLGAGWLICLLLEKG